MLGTSPNVGVGARSNSLPLIDTYISVATATDR
jgi:hypothetical protein